MMQELDRLPDRFLPLGQRAGTNVPGLAPPLSGEERVLGTGESFPPRLTVRYGSSRDGDKEPEEAPEAGETALQPATTSK